MKYKHKLSRNILDSCPPLYWDIQVSYVMEGEIDELLQEQIRKPKVITAYFSTINILIMWRYEYNAKNIFLFI